jgi:hypothetical protein
MILEFLYNASTQNKHSQEVQKITPQQSTVAQALYKVLTLLKVLNQVFVCSLKNAH